MTFRLGTGVSVRTASSFLEPGEVSIETSKRTRLARAFCSAQDRNVPVLRREGRRTESAPRTGHRDPELVTCLDYGVRCTGWMCPLFSLPTLPPEEILEEAIARERERKRRDVAGGRAILERALREGRVLRKRRRPREDQPSPETSGRGS